MKKHLLMIIGLTMIGNVSIAQTKDTMRMIEMQKVEVTSTRANEKTPMAYSNIGKEQIAKINYGQDLPFLLLMSPSVVTTSDAGTGVGYTGIRVRGTDATRINVTSNGIPMNDAESHSLFWVNVPDFASSVEDIQLQRGVGTSTNGAGAFGGSINIRTENPSSEPYGELSASYGSFNTHKESLKVGTGLIGGHWTFNARLSNLQSDGYVDRASTDLKSYFAQAGYYARNTVVKFITFAGDEKTYHAWNGLDADKLGTDRTYNSCGEIRNAKDSVVGFYNDQTDNYRQQNYQLLITQMLAPKWSLNVNFHYTDGYGYYQEYKNGRTLKEYGLVPFVYQGETIKKSNLVRQKLMDNGFGGGVFSLDYKGDLLRASFGGAVNRYSGDHFGRVIWVKDYVGELTPDHEYYRNHSIKDDGNLYLKADITLTKGLSLYADMQYRHISHSINGANDNWDWNADKMQALTVDNKYDFFNPKAGLFYKIDERQSVYGSFAIANKEPTRNNFTDAKVTAAPKSERLIDYELGYNFVSRNFSAGLNLYYMQYRDQLILTGELNEIGEPLAENIPDSYRMGIEAQVGVQFTKWLRWDVNATLSSNKIKDYSEYVYHADSNGDPVYNEDWSAAVTVNNIGDATIAFSPSFIANSTIVAQVKGWSASLQSSYVSKQYMTNAMVDECSLDAYFVNNLRVDYAFRIPTLRGVSVGVSVNNIFNEQYETNGWGASSYIITEGAKAERNDASGYYPQAGTNVLANITLRF